MGSIRVPEFVSVFIPVVVSRRQIGFRCFSPSYSVVKCLVQVELAFDYGKGLRIDVGVLARRQAERAIAAVLRRISIRISSKQVPIGGAGKLPAGILPDLLEFAGTLRRLAVGEIGYGVIAVDRHDVAILSSFDDTDFVSSKSLYEKSIAM